MTVSLRVEQVSKTFVLHHQNGIRLPVLESATLEVKAGMRGAARPLRQR